jgi:hypothetical protein
MDINPSLRGGVKTLPFLTGFTILGGNFQGMEPHGQARGPQKQYPPTPLGAEALRRASANASVGHPPVNEIRRSMADPSLKGFLSEVTHSSTAKAVVSCVGG